MAEEEQQEGKAICWSGCAAPELATQQRARMGGGGGEAAGRSLGGQTARQRRRRVLGRRRRGIPGARSPTVKAAYDCCLRDPQQLKEDVHEAGSVYVDHRCRRRRCRRRLPSSSSSQSSVYCHE